MKTRLALQLLTSIALGIVSFAAWQTYAETLSAFHPATAFYFIPVLAMFSTCGKNCADSPLLLWLSNGIGIVLLAAEWFLILKAIHWLYRSSIHRIARKTP